MSELEAVDALREAQLVAVAQGGLGEIKELQGKCLDAGIPAMIARPDAGCGSAKCSPRLHLMVRDRDMARVIELMQRAWAELVAREGVALPTPGLAEATSDELPCPACGASAPLVAGACSDCGLQLE